MDPAFRKAAEEGDIISLQELVAVKPNITYSMATVEKNTALHIAASKGHTLFVHHFLLCVDINTGLIASQNIDGDTPLHLAVIAGHVEVVEHLIQYLAWARSTHLNFQEPLIVQNKEGNTLLHEAVIHRRCHLADKLIEAASKVKRLRRTLEVMITKKVEDVYLAQADDFVWMNYVLLILRNADRQTPLHLAVKGDSFEMIEMLIKCGEVVKGELPRKYPKIPMVIMHPVFMRAAYEGDIVSLINEVAVNPYMIYSTTRNDQNTALHIAASEGHMWFVHHVLFYTNLNVELSISENIDGDTPLHLAVRSGHLEVVDHLIWYFMWARGIYANSQEPLIMQNKNGNTPLHEAVVHSTDQNLMVVNLLEGANKVMWKTPEGLIKEYDKYADNVVRILDVLLIIRNADGNTALHLAAKKGNMVLIEMLMKCSQVIKVELTTQYVKRSIIMSNKEGNTPLHEAVIHQMQEAAMKLLKANPRCAHVLNVQMQSPFYIAAREGFVPVVKEIVDQGLSTDCVSSNGTALHQAVLGDSTGALEILLNNAVELVDLTDSSGNTSLHSMAQNDNAHMVSMLLNKKSSIAYKKNNEQHTPLHVAAKYGSAEAAKNLLMQCPDATAMVDIDGRNAFHIAVINDKVNVLKLLKYVLLGEILNQQDMDGNTPLHLAAELRNMHAIVCLLDDFRVNPLVINRHGHTAWIHSQIPENLITKIPRVLMNHALRNAIDAGDVSSVLSLLADNPSIIYAVTLHERNTALHLAASNGNDWFVRHVLLYTNRNVGFSICENTDGNTPLHLAVGAGHLEVVEQLIRYVAWAREIEANLKEPLIVQNKKGNTLLHEAVIHGVYDVAAKLLDAAKEVPCKNHEVILEYKEYENDLVSLYDALLVIRNNDGDTPLHVAVKRGNSGFVDMLIRCAQVMKVEPTTRYTEGPIIMGNSKKNTPLHVAVLLRMSDIALMLLEANPRCGHMPNAAMEPPLYIAARDNLTHVVKKIADQGLSVTFISTQGTALHQSVLRNNIRVLEMLLNRYEELVELTDSYGNNALHYAAQYNNGHMVTMLLNKKSTLAYKQNIEGHTPLHVATNCSSMEAARDLLKQCPDVSEMVDRHGRNAFHIAVINSKVNVLKLLLKYVLPEKILNQQDLYGNTPLHHAATICLAQPGLLLLRDPRVNPSLFNRDGHTAFAISHRTATLEMSADQINLWKELKKREPVICKQQGMVTTQRYRQPQQDTIPLTEINIDRYVIVATLMIMATFAAMLSMPGGYNRQSGTTIVGQHQAFRIFLVCNTISMCGLIALVLCFIGGRWNPVKLKVNMLVWGNKLVVLFGLGMIMSMLTAVYLAVAPASRWVAYTAVGIAVTTPFLACLIRKSVLPTNWRGDTRHSAWNRETSGRSSLNPWS